jgi:hypothetical protein
VVRRKQPEFTVEEVGDSYPPWRIIYGESEDPTVVARSLVGL